MISEQDFLLLLNRVEDETLDFKATSYDLSNDQSKANLLKDVLCMANTPRDECSYLVLGVKKHPNGSYDLVGIDRHIDDADLQAQFSERVYPVPEVHYCSLPYRGQSFGIVSIPSRRIGPCVPIRDYGQMLRQRQVYFRRGSKNEVAMPDDINQISNWIRGVEGQHVPSEGPEAWDELLESVHGFRATRRYVLLASPDVTSEFVSGIGRVPWIEVVDFDPDSDTNGLLKATRSVLETHRSLHPIVIGDRPVLNTDRATYWFFARGLTGRENTLTPGSWRDWTKRYASEVAEQFRRLLRVTGATPVCFLALWYENELTRHLRSCLEAALGIFTDAIEIVIATDDPAALQSVAAEFDAKLVAIPLHQLCSGLDLALSAAPTEVTSCDLPTSSGAPVRLDLQDRLWMEEELDIVHTNVGLTPPDGTIVGNDFLRGSEISWYELGLHFDVDRDKTGKLERRVRTELDKKRTVRVNLYHAPGAGGTTVARHIVWRLHTEYPSAVLLRCDPQVTAERLFRLSSLTGKPVLLLIDSSQIADREVDELFSQLRSRLVPVVLFQTLRRFRSQVERERSVYLPAELSPAEAQRFYEIYSRIEPSRRERLERLLSSADTRSRTAFYFGLETFGEDFLGLGPYVGIRLSNLSSVQRRILGYLAMAHHYAQRPLSSQAFAGLLGMPRTRVVALEKVFPEETLDLLVEASDGEWRTAHELLATEALEQLLSASQADQRLWSQSLSTWAIEFAEFCRGETVIPTDEMLEVTRRTFIYRDNVDLLGTERSASQTFSQLIEEVPSREGGLEILRALVDLYPEEAHFWAHLGRYYSIQMRNYDRALECSEKAIEFQPEDPLLYHMHGMTLRYKIQAMMEERIGLDQIVPCAKTAGEYFEEARELSPDEEHGFISEVQMLIRVLDYAGKQNAEGIMGYLAIPSADPFLREAIDRAEDLLEQVRRNREGEGPSKYEQDCRGKINLLYGRHETALRIWDNLLSRQDTYRPPLRRQIVWTYLARRGRDWGRLDPREIDRIVGLLEENVEEDPANEKDLRLWVQAVRLAKHPPSIESIVEKLSYWRANSGALDSIYYLYVFHALLAMEGSAISRADAIRYMEESRQLARPRSNRTKSFEWLGRGSGAGKLVHQSSLGEWDQNREFWERTEHLERTLGRIAKIEGPQAGRIETIGGLFAFFVPSRSGHAADRFLNQSVSFYLGFSYDGLRAWEVENATA